MASKEGNIAASPALPLPVAGERRKKKGEKKGKKRRGTRDVQRPHLKTSAEHRQLQAKEGKGVETLVSNGVGPDAQANELIST